MKVYHVYKRPGYDKMTEGYDEFAAGEWHYCGTWSNEQKAKRRADGLVREGTSIRILTSYLNPLHDTEEVIEFGATVYRGDPQSSADQELQPLSSNAHSTSPITQSPDSSPSKSRLGPLDFHAEDWFRFSSWV